MEEYRVYFLGPDGRITRRIDFASADDDAAEEQARLLADDCAVELWQGHRKVAEFGAQRRPGELDPQA